MSELEKPFPEKKIKKKNWKSMSTTKTTSEKEKFGWKKTRPRINHEKIGKTTSKKVRSNNWKNSKNQSEIAACEQKKPLARKQMFVQTPFSHSTWKLKQKHFTPQNHSCSTFCFGVAKITTPIWLQKTWKCVQKKDKAPKQFKFFEL